MYKQTHTRFSSCGSWFDDLMNLLQNVIHIFPNPEVASDWRLPKILTLRVLSQSVNWCQRSCRRHTIRLWLSSRTWKLRDNTHSHTLGWGLPSFFTERRRFLFYCLSSSAFGKWPSGVTLGQELLTAVTDFHFRYFQRRGDHRRSLLILVCFTICAMITIPYPHRLQGREMLFQLCTTITINALWLAK